MAEPIALTVSAAEQASILRAAADRVHAAKGIVFRHDVTDGEWTAYVVARRRVALDMVAELAVCRALGLESLPPWLAVKGAAGHMGASLRLDWVDLGAAPFTALATVEGESLRFWGCMPLEWVATAETDPAHRFRSVSREGDLCVRVPSYLLVGPEEVRENLAAMADGSASFPLPPADPSPAVAAAAPETPSDAGGSEGEVTHQELTEEQRATLPEALARYGTVTWEDGQWVPLDAIRERAANPPTAAEEEPKSDHVEATPGQMAAGLARAAGRLITQGVASAEVKASRLSVCNACPHKLPSGRCAKCGCFLAAKTAVAGEACPLGYW
jgi:hypothetical protein